MFPEKPRGKNLLGEKFVDGRMISKWMSAVRCRLMTTDYQEEFSTTTLEESGI
jgi:hypothetical protein